MRTTGWAIASLGTLMLLGCQGAVTSQVPVPVAHGPTKPIGSDGYQVLWGWGCEPCTPLVAPPVVEVPVVEEPEYMPEPEEYQPSEPMPEQEGKQPKNPTPESTPVAMPSPTPMPPSSPPVAVPSPTPMPPSPMPTPQQTAEPTPTPTPVVTPTPQRTPCPTPTPQRTPCPVVSAAPTEQAFVAKLTGASEVPPRQTPATGEARLTYIRSQQQLHFTLTVQNIKNVTQAHIHLGGVGKNGPVVVQLYGPADPNGGPVSGRLAVGLIQAKDLKGPLAGKTIADLVKAMSDGGTYVNVHTDDACPPANSRPGDFEAGEIRGQIGAE